MILCPVCGNFTDSTTCEVCGIKLSIDPTAEYRGKDKSTKSDHEKDH